MQYNPTHHRLLQLIDNGLQILVEQHHQVQQAQPMVMIQVLQMVEREVIVIIVTQKLHNNLIKECY
tara:strand:+ start:2304 stop:2501 length:198 start_codon:yes stop_codon:yes gene_type:complete